MSRADDLDRDLRLSETLRKGLQRDLDQALFEKDGALRDARDLRAEVSRLQQELANVKADLQTMTERTAETQQLLFHMEGAMVTAVVNAHRDATNWERREKNLLETNSALHLAKQAANARVAELADEIERLLNGEADAE